MKFTRYLGALVAIALVLSCAQPPKAEIDAARTKVGAAQKDADILTYAPDALQQAKEALARMEKDISARKYTEAKADALKASALADKAKTDVNSAKEKVKAEASALVDEGKKQLAALLPTVATAKKAKPAGLDLAALETELASATAGLTDAGNALAAGKYAAARDGASAAKASFSDIEKRIADAIQKARKKK